MTKHSLMETAVIGIVGKRMAGPVMEAYSVCFESDEGNAKDYEVLRKKAVYLLAEANALNVMHWNIDTSSKHELLNEAYELCRDTGDQLAETYMSETGKSCRPDNGSDLASSKYDEKDALNRLKEIKRDMADALDQNDGFGEGIKNIFADFDEQMTGIIYKYQQFTA